MHGQCNAGLPNHKRTPKDLAHTAGGSGMCEQLAHSIQRQGEPPSPDGKHNDIFWQT